MPTLFIDGAAGTTGLEIAERLDGRSAFDRITLTDADRRDAGKRRDALNSADFVILCLPDEAAHEAVAMIANPAVRVIDASSAHRTADGWTYGFAELSDTQRAAIATASRVTNPGCYPTGFVALIAPLVQAGLVARDAPLTVHAVSGFSGGGKALIERFAAEPTLAWRGYGLSLAHKHVPEMQRYAGLTTPPIFSPAVVPAFRGMVVEVPLHLRPGDAARAHAALIAHYRDSATVTVAPTISDPGELVLHDGEAASDAMTLAVYANADGSQVRLIARLDNLGKGASGACIQNLNLMAGLPETDGLRL